jgi:malate/lactate dehydrogenase
MDVLHSTDSLENQDSVRFKIFTAAQLSVQSSQEHSCVIGRVVPDVPSEYSVFICIFAKQ